MIIRDIFCELVERTMIVETPVPFQTPRAVDDEAEKEVTWMNSTAGTDSSE